MIDLDKLEKLSRYRPVWVTKVFPSKTSLKWFVQENKDALLLQGALVKLSRDWFVHVDQFPLVVQPMMLQAHAEALKAAIARVEAKESSSLVQKRRPGRPRKVQQAGRAA
jgi:hypothetical protein